MKKLMSVVLLGAILVFTSCGNDDDSSTPVTDCQICNLDLLGTIVSPEYCDNGDGTITITLDGQEQTESLDGVTFSEFITALESFGYTCN